MRNTSYFWVTLVFRPWFTSVLDEKQEVRDLRHQRKARNHLWSSLWRRSIFFVQKRNLWPQWSLGLHSDW